MLNAYPHALVIISVHVLLNNSLAAEPADSASAANWSANTEQQSAAHAARSQQLQTDLATLKQRQQRVVDTTGRKQMRDWVNALLQGIAQNAKKPSKDQQSQQDPLFVPEVGTRFSKRTLRPDLGGVGISGYVQFNEFLRKRGTDLIVVLMPKHQQSYGHLLVDGMKPGDELYPDFNKSMIALVEAGVELVDPREAFARFPISEGFVNFPGDHHWGYHGRRLVAEELGKRLQRYAPVRQALDQYGSQFKAVTLKRKNGKSFPAVSYSGPDQATWNLAAALGWGGGFIRTNGSGDQNQRSMYTPIMCIGDSQVGFWGDTFSGIYQLLAKNCGMVVGMVGRRNASPEKSIQEYIQGLPYLEVEPKVVIMANTSIGCKDMGPFFENLVIKKVDKDAEIHQPIRKCIMRVLRVSEIPADLTDIPYKSAYRTIDVEALNGLLQGRRFQVVHQVMKDRKLLPGPPDRAGKTTPIKVGMILSSPLQSWTMATKANTDLGSVTILDDSDNLFMPRYLAPQLRQSRHSKAQENLLPKAGD